MPGSPEPRLLYVQPWARLCPCHTAIDTTKTGTRQRFPAALGLKGGESILPCIAGIFFKDAVCIDRFLDDALEKKKKEKNQCPSDCTRKGSRLVKKLQQAYWEMDFSALQTLT